MFFFFFTSVSISLHVCLCNMYVLGAPRSEEALSDLLELEIHMVVSLPQWVLGNELGSTKCSLMAELSADPRGS